MRPVRSSRFLNTELDVEFVGTQACVECHEDEHESYSRTTHSRALADIDAGAEPKHVQFDHALSRRRFRVQKRGNQIWHQELIFHDGKEKLLAEYPVRYAIGSGALTRSYLIEEDGFLLESPITWYAGEKGWWVSPGYDVASAMGFQRVADIGCVACHAGRVERANDTRFRVDLHELTIGCESCHGPGASHVSLQQSSDQTSEDDDFTIVHPDRLGREGLESICGQCHLRGDATVVLRNRDLSDFRPGQLLSDFRTDYVLQPHKQMTVTGHVEQMRLSKCYQSSEMTCTTCHDLHAKPAAEAGVEHHRAKCMECHADCGLDHDARVERQADDNCAACHMPRGVSEIPHVGITQHRIGIHGENTSVEAETLATETLVPIFSEAHLPQRERNRNLGLAYLELSDKQKTERLFNRYRLAAESLLDAAADRQLRDGDVESARSRFAWERDDLPLAIRLATNAILYEGASGATANALFVLGNSQWRLGASQDALKTFDTLTKVRRRPDDWFLLGLCYRQIGRVDQAIASMETAVRIDPSRQDIRDALASLLSDSSDASAASRHRRIIQMLNDTNDGPSSQ